MDNKCSWCINTALKYVNSTKRTILDSDHGRKDSGTETQVKEVVRQLRLNEHYEEYEDTAYNRINALIDLIPEVTSPCGEAVLRCAIFGTLEKIYKVNRLNQFRLILNAGVDTYLHPCAFLFFRSIPPAKDGMYFVKR